jgi:hypothetical protein
VGNKDDTPISTARRSPQAGLRLPMPFSTVHIRQVVGFGDLLKAVLDAQENE